MAEEEVLTRFSAGAEFAFESRGTPVVIRPPGRTLTAEGPSGTTPGLADAVSGRPCPHWVS